jgi:hypothetical protein
MSMRSSLATGLLFGTLIGAGCNCEEPQIIRVAPELQIQAAEGELGEGDPPICSVEDESDCALNFGDIGISMPRSRTLLLANKANVPLDLHSVHLDPESPHLPELRTTWGADGESLLGGGEFVAFKVWWTPSFEMEEGAEIGTLILVTNAANAEEPTDFATCQSFGATRNCGLTRIKLTGRGVDMGLPEAKIVARVGALATDGGPCDFGYVGVNGLGSCRVEVTNIGERDLLIYEAELGFRDVPRSDCQTCQGHAWCGGEGGACIAGPYVSEEARDGDDWAVRTACDAERPCALGSFCASDAHGEGGFCADEAEAAEGRPLFRFEETISFSRDNPMVITPGSSLTLTLVFQPQALRRYSSQLRLATNEVSKPWTEIGMLGVGHLAPTAVARILSVGGGDPISDENGSAQVAPMDTITVTAMQSFGSNGAEIIGWEWSFAETVEVGAFRAFNSRLEFQDPGAEETTLGFWNNVERWIAGTDIIGTYRLALRVQDEHGVWSEWDTADFANIPGDSIHVELTWDHPSSDVDLHVIRTADRMQFRTSNDCYFANCKPSIGGVARLRWGQADEDGDDPILDLDDVNGFGPENINIDEPEDDQTYLVGVHYWSARDSNIGRGTLATMRIYIWGQLVMEAEQLLEETGNWWEVGVISWPDADVELRNEFFETTPR